MIYLIGGDHGGDTDSFHPSMWDEERERRQQIHFEFNDDVGDQVFFCSVIWIGKR